MPFEFDRDDAPPYPVHVPGQASPGDTGRHGWTYTPALGEFIACEYAEGTAPDRDGARASRDGGLWGLHAALPDRVPPPGIVRAWCRQFPAFGTLMRQAEELRAERLIEETVVLADTSPLAAPRVALQIATRQRLAESLDRVRWGGGASGANAPQLARPGEQPVAVEYSDAQLLALIEAGRAGADGGDGGGGTPR